MGSKLIYTPPTPHRCLGQLHGSLSEERAPIGSIAECDCGRRFIMRACSDERALKYWTPLRWYHHKHQQIRKGHAS